MKRFLKFYLFAFIMLSDFVVFAQGEEDENGDLEGNDPEPAPINGKLFILAIMGILFAIYSYKNYKKEA
jgi:hypothetical protein